MINRPIIDVVTTAHGSATSTKTPAMCEATKCQDNHVWSLTVQLPAGTKSVIAVCQEHKEVMESFQEIGTVEIIDDALTTGAMALPLSSFLALMDTV